MKTKNYHVSPLSKKQMNDVRGGYDGPRYQCLVTFQNGKDIYYNVEAPDATFAKDVVLTEPGAVDADCYLIQL